jgi:hypothetical protein
MNVMIKSLCILFLVAPLPVFADADSIKFDLAAAPPRMPAAPSSLQIAQLQDSPSISAVSGNATSPSTHDTTRYALLIVPAVSLLFVLASRQGRISTIIRENTKTIVGITQPAEEPRCKNLIEQNTTLGQRFVEIQIALLMICVSLLVLGMHACVYFFDNEFLLILAGIPFMVVGTFVVAKEMLRASDTIYHEMAFAEWHADGRDKEAEPIYRSHVWKSHLRQFFRF